MAVGLSDCHVRDFSSLRKKEKKGRTSAEHSQSHCQQHKHLTSQNLLSLVAIMASLRHTTIRLNIQSDIYGFICYKEGSTSVLIPK